MSISHAIVYLCSFQLVKRSEKRIEAEKSLAEAQENGML